MDDDDPIPLNDYYHPSNILRHLPLEKTAIDLSRILKRVINKQYICCNINGEKTWYYFSDTIWKIDTKCDLLRHDMCTIVYDTVMNLLNYDPPDDFLGSPTKYKSTVVAIANCFQSKTIQNRIIGMYSVQVYDSTFAEKLDSNNHLIGFQNGVLDLKRGCFRPAVPEDYLSQCIPYDWVDHDDLDIQAEIKDFIASTQVNQEVADYLLKTIAYMLSGYKYLEEFWIWTGNCNKSLTTLIEKTFGPYYHSLPSTVLTSPRTSSLNPELLNCRNKKCIYVSKQNSMKLNSSIIKGLVKNLTINVRNRYSSELIPVRTSQFGMIVQCNDIPRLRATIYSKITRHLRIIHFRAMIDGDEFRLINTDDIRYAQQFMRILFEVYMRFVKGPQFIPAPEHVLTATREFLDNNAVD